MFIEYPDWTHKDYTSCLYYKSFTIVIFNQNDSTIIIYDYNDSGQYYKTKLLSWLRLGS